MNFKSFSTQKRKQRAEIVLKLLHEIFPQSSTILKFGNPLELLLAVMLSAQTTDKQVNKVTEKLFSKYKSIQDYYTTTPELFEKDIQSINHYKTKAKRIIETVKILVEQYNGKLPKTLEDFITLPGVGRKTAHVVMGNIYGEIDGIAVDTHVIRLTKKWGLTKAKTQKNIEQDLMQIIPKNEWFSFTNRVIEYGRAYSPARGIYNDNDIISKELLLCN
jgi:endonuclease-3